jgi:hypothetical protein
MARARGFEWDRRSAQPVQLGGRVSNFLSGFGDLLPMSAMACRNALHIPAVLRRYRALERATPARTVDPAAMGLAVSFDPAAPDPGRLRAAWQASGAGTLLCRVLAWEEAALEAEMEFIRSFGLPRERVVIAVVQDRASVMDPDLWQRRFERITAAAAPLAAFIQIGHGSNRKKWGFRTPGEYAAFALRSRAGRSGDLRFIGPGVLDFEPHYLDAILHRTGPGLFDVINSLLYVDRRGMPERPQGWGRYDLGGKLRLMRAVADTNGCGARPLWVTEVNWPLCGTGKYAPAGPAVRVSEETYADYLARYYLLAFATGIPERIIWWELAAHGYGLIDDRDGAFRLRPGYEAFRTLARLLPGRVNAGLRRRDDLLAAAFRGPADTLVAVWSLHGPRRVPLVRVPSRVWSARGVELPPAGMLDAGPAPVLNLFEGGLTLEETLAV